MNISPTPRRYNSKGSDIPRATDEHFHPFNRDIPMIPSDRIIPEEYRVNSQMINKLIKQNKDLTLQLERKQDEIDRLNVLVGSLRGKLIKYTELNKKLSQNNASQPPVSSNQSPYFSPDDVLQVNKARAKESSTSDSKLETRIGDIYSKLDALTSLMTSTIGGNDNSAPRDSHVTSRQTRPSSSSATADSVIHRSLHAASEDEILTQESAELKSLENQIDLLKRKLLIKRENELRKLSLNKELLDLMDKLDMSKPALGMQSSPPLENITNISPHCDQCHKSATQTTASGKQQTGTKATHSSNPPYMSMAQALETPTPAQRNMHKNSDTLW
ncbi:LANO_0D04368g1_1 [Lachancea nothofagi CBS 11611]|uniref:Spindle pole body component SPC42 n=1 Tax=Lachancea nothofagi CBS 11611 TaxID=1266666 RepID=A0A1G4JG45_9SACH|nr:LANO_0D04368g1_1 [Lachancea nothofagi CBS 11611]